MRLRRPLPPQPFDNKFRGKPSVLPSMGEYLKYFWRARKGGTGQIEMYATAPVGTEIWIRYGVHYRRGNDSGRAEWQCLARVTKTEQLRPGNRTHFPYFRTTFELIGEPEKSDY